MVVDIGIAKELKHFDQDKSSDCILVDHKIVVWWVTWLFESVVEAYDAEQDDFDNRCASQVQELLAAEL